MIKDRQQIGKKKYIKWHSTPDDKESKATKQDIIQIINDQAKIGSLQDDIETKGIFKVNNNEDSCNSILTQIYRESYEIQKEVGKPANRVFCTEKVYNALIPKIKDGVLDDVFRIYNFDKVLKNEKIEIYYTNTNHITIGCKDNSRENKKNNYGWVENIDNNRLPTFRKNKHYRISLVRFIKENKKDYEKRIKEEKLKREK